MGKEREVETTKLMALKVADNADNIDGWLTCSWMIDKSNISCTFEFLSW